MKQKDLESAIQAGLVILVLVGYRLDGFLGAAVVAIMATVGFVAGR